MCLTRDVVNTLFGFEFVDAGHDFVASSLEAGDQNLIFLDALELEVGDLLLDIHAALFQNWMI